MKFSIITPSLNRESLVRCCESVDAQTYTGGFEHIIAFDGIPDSHVPQYSFRRKSFVFRQTSKWGNYQRHSAWKYAKGEFLWYVDDDNFLSHPDALKDIATRLELAGNPAWGLFPIMRHGSVFLHDPPGMCHTDTLNMVIKREFAQWPNTEAREADGILADKLKAEHPYVAFSDCPSIGIMEHSSNGL
jgi:glycosyltransferase involved in cell wall biosynthesis